MIDERAYKPIARRSPLPALIVDVALALAAGALALPARGDVVVMKNGDRLTGKTVHKMADELVFVTTYAGTLKLKWSDIASLVTDKPVTVMISEERILAGKLGSGLRLASVALDHAKRREAFGEKAINGAVSLAKLRPQFAGPADKAPIGEQDDRAACCCDHGHDR